VEQAGLPVVNMTSSLRSPMRHLHVTASLAAALALGASVFEPANAQVVSSCVIGDERAQRLRDKVAELRSSPDPQALQFLESHGFSALPDSAIQVVADSLTCAQARQAYDARRVVETSTYVAKPDSVRTLYVIRMGASDNAVYDSDPDQRAGHYGRVFWFSDGFASFKFASGF
jgi:hypothetical protein